MWPEGCFSHCASFHHPVTETLQFFTVYSHLYYPEQFCIMTKPCHFTVCLLLSSSCVSLPSKQHISPGDTTADQPLPQDLTMSSHSLFPRFFIHSFFIHPVTFPFMPWLSLKAFSERCCLQVSGNKSWLCQQDILYPKAHWHLQRTPVGPYGRTSLYKSHADFSTAHHCLPMCPLIQYFSLVSTKQQYNTNLHLASCAAERDKIFC